MVPPKAKTLSPRLASALHPLRPPGYSPVRGEKRHPGAREGCAAQAAGRAGRRRRCPRRGAGAGGTRRWRERRRGRRELRAGKAVDPELLRDARALPITGSAKAALELLPLEGEGGEGEGRRHAAGREGKRRGWGRAWGAGEMITQNGEEEGRREARKNPSKVPTRRAWEGEIQMRWVSSPPPPLLPFFSLRALSLGSSSPGSGWGCSPGSAAAGAPARWRGG